MKAGPVSSGCAGSQELGEASGRTARLPETLCSGTAPRAWALPPPRSVTGADRAQLDGAPWTLTETPLVARLSHYKDVFGLT